MDRKPGDNHARSPVRYAHDFRRYRRETGQGRAADRLQEPDGLSLSQVISKCSQAADAGFASLCVQMSTSIH